VNAQEVKEGLRRRHPGNTAGSMPGQWTCIEEWLAIDLLALNAWRKADVIGYEVKVSRSDLRRELLRPHKRAVALERTSEFYLAVPEGLLTKEEIAYEEPEWKAVDFDRQPCPGVPRFGAPPAHRRHWDPDYKPFGGPCSTGITKTVRGHIVRVPLPPEIYVAPEWLAQYQERYSPEEFLARIVEVCQAESSAYAPCWTCGGKGYLERSRVEREAPICWVPRDVGLVIVGAHGTRVAKPSPKRKAPRPIADSQQAINDLVRWVSHRPDPRHR
jgi:hypothetical protein